ncbi:hypothetical protein CUJ91_04295 [Paraburkholderia graminis]|nr:hypothetical protein CUJ91_04295 [Paraburkholderia graminis]
MVFEFELLRISNGHRLIWRNGRKIAVLQDGMNRRLNSFYVAKMVFHSQPSTLHVVENASDQSQVPSFSCGRCSELLQPRRLRGKKVIVEVFKSFMLLWG